MAEPRALEGMQWDDRQQLKEAVCDAVLERTRRVVSGEGAHGAAVLGEKPSRVLSSAFILPRLNEDGDDELSDIKIPSHGMDLRVRPSGGCCVFCPVWQSMCALFRLRLNCSHAMVV